MAQHGGLKSSSFKRSSSRKKKGGRCRLRRSKPAYDIDEQDTDGYIYWHENTRKTLGWVYLRFQPDRWYFEFIFMARKAGIVAATITLGKVGDGWLAWVTITAITLTAIGLQLAFVPFPVDTAKAEQVLCECAPEACSPDGPLKLLSVFLMSVKNPSLNDLQLAGLICQLATLACGLLCVTINRPDVNFVIGCCSLAAMGCFVALVLHFWHVSLAAVLADRYQEKTRYHEKVSREPTASAKKTLPI